MMRVVPFSADCNAISASLATLSDGRELVSAVGIEPTTY